MRMRHCCVDLLTLNGWHTNWQLALYYPVTYRLYPDRLRKRTKVSGLYGIGLQNNLVICNLSVKQSTVIVTQTDFISSFDMEMEIIIYLSRDRPWLSRKSDVGDISTI